MQFLIIAQIISIVAIVSSAEAKSTDKGHKKPSTSTSGASAKDAKLSKTSRGVFETSGLGVSDGGLFEAGAGGTGMLTGSGFQTNGAFQTPGGGGVISGEAFQAGGAFASGGILGQNGGSAKYAHQKMQSESSQSHHEEKQELSILNQGAGMLGAQNTGCSNAYGGAGFQDMSQTIQTISMNVQRIYETVSSILNNQGQLSSRMDAFDSSLQGINSRIENFASEIQSQTQYLQQVVQSTQTTSTAIAELQQTETKNNDFLNQLRNKESSPMGGGEVNGVLDDLRGTLQRISTQVSQSFQDENIMIRELKQATNSLANNVNELSSSMQNSGGSSLTPEMLQTYFETHQSAIINAFRSEIRSILESVQAASTNMDAGSISNQLRGSVQSMYQLQTLLRAVNRMILEIHGRVMQGCTVHVQGGPGNSFKMRQERHRKQQSSSNTSEAEVIEQSGQQQMGQTQNSWPIQNQNWMTQRKANN